MIFSTETRCFFTHGELLLDRLLISGVLTVLFENFTVVSIFKLNLNFIIINIIIIFLIYKTFLYLICIDVRTIFRKTIKKKSKPEKPKIREIILEKGQVDVDMALVDETDSNYNIKALRQKLKKERGLSAPKLFKLAPLPSTLSTPAESKTSSPSDTDIKKPVKLNKTVKLPGEEVEEADEKKRKRKRKIAEIEDIKLEMDATLIEVDDEPLGNRLPTKEPSVNVKANAYYLNDREIFINFINSIFKDYGDILKNEDKKDINVILYPNLNLNLSH